MPNYRRWRVPGGTVFLTVVTHERRPLFADPENVVRLRQAIRTVMREMPFEIEGAVVLPDHCHFLWTLPAGDDAYSKRMGRIKVEFTHALRGRHALPVDASPSRRKHRDSDVWQRRFMEHTIRDESDFEEHLNYIHYNPVKHEYAACPHAWPYSSFSKWIARGAYTERWGCSCAGQAWQAPPWKEISEYAE